MHVIYPNVLGPDFDEENIDWNMYRRVEYLRMLNWTIDRFSPDDFYLDDTKIIRNRIFHTDNASRYGHYILGSLDLGYKCVYIFNSALSDRARKNYTEYMEGVWVPKDVCLLPKHGALIGKHIGWNNMIEGLFGPGATCNGWKNWRDAPGYKEVVG